MFIVKRDCGKIGKTRITVIRTMCAFANDLNNWRSGGLSLALNRVRQGNCDSTLIHTKRSKKLCQIPFIIKATIGEIPQYRVTESGKNLFENKKIKLHEPK